MRDSVAETAMTVNLTRIYTKLGDGGETHLGDMSRVSKLHPRVEAYGTVDELNATIGVALLQPDLSAKFDAWLRRVQNDLLDLGADLSVPAAPEESAGHDAGHNAGEGVGEGADAPPPKRERLRVGGDYVQWLEQACDEVNATLAPLRSFVIPGGTPAAAHLHVCRTVCRRAERRTIAVGAEVNPEVVRYLNRLSDLLFILSRAANVASSPASSPEGEGEGEPGGEQNGDGHSTEPLWDPGAHGSDADQGASDPGASDPGAS
jgi:cob(I)alamin adenosyltransferase